MSSAHNDTPFSPPSERSPLLIRRFNSSGDATSISEWTKESHAVANTSVGERMPYSDYTSIDWLHDLVKETYRKRELHSLTGIRNKLYAAFEACTGWITVAIIGILMAFIACGVDFAVAYVSGLKFGYCSTNPLLSRETCCRVPGGGEAEDCVQFKAWGDTFGVRFGVYVAWAALFGIISSTITMLSKKSLPTAAPGHGDHHVTRSGKDADTMDHLHHEIGRQLTGKSLYMAAGSGIPEIKTILTGWVIPHYLDLKVLITKGFGAVFSVATGMALGKEGPFVHMAACIGHFVASFFPKYRENGRQYREILTASCAAGVSAAFGAPIGGVLFAYEELSYFFPRKVLWRTFLCSMIAAITLKLINPHKTGKLVLFETNYGTTYRPIHYVTFMFIGCCGGIWGGTFTRANQIWAKWFRGHNVIRNYPVFEAFIVIMITALLQFPNPLTRSEGAVIIRNLLVNCAKLKEGQESWVCDNEGTANRAGYVGWLAYGTIMQLFATTITFGVKVPAGIIIPALDAGALFGRLVGQWAAVYISPGIFAMVGSGAFLAGVTRMTVSLVVIMFELTGDLEYVIPHMIAIMCAKWTADALSKESIYDLAQSVLGHPFLNEEEALELMVHHESATVQQIIPPPAVMHDVTIHVPTNNKVPRRILEEKLEHLQQRGLMDGGLVLVQNHGILQGYIAQNELEYGLNVLGASFPSNCEVRVLGQAIEEGSEFDLSNFVDRSPVSIPADAPMEIAVELFTKVGVRYLCVTEPGSGKLAGVCIKKRIIAYLDGLKEHE